MDDKESNTVTMFDMKGGAYLKLIDLALNGKDGKARQTKYAVFISEPNTLEHYNLLMDNCDVYNFQQTDGAVISAQKGTFADTVRIVNSTVSNSYRGIALNREKDDKASTMPNM